MVRISSYNCKNIKTSHAELCALCETHAIVFQQETWLAKNELSLLSNTHCDFIVNGVSSIVDELKLNSGRANGDIRILSRKNMNKHCSFKTYTCIRIVGIEINCGRFNALFLCVYMPCHSSENYDDFMFCLSKLVHIADEFPSPYIFMCGDFNANIQHLSRFDKELIDGCDANFLCISDKMLFPNDTYTFISYSHSTTLLLLWGSVNKKKHSLHLLQKKALPKFTNSDYVAHTELICKKLKILKFLDMFSVAFGIQINE